MPWTSRLLPVLLSSLGLVLFGVSCKAQTPAPSATAAAVPDTTPVVWQAGNAAVQVRVHGDGGYSVWRAGTEWLSSGPTALHSQGHWYATSGGSDALPLALRRTSKSVGQDSLGAYDAYGMSWDAGGMPFETSVRVYRRRPLVVFAQRFPRGATHLALTADEPSPALKPRRRIGNYQRVLSAFPSFQVAGRLARLPYLTYHGTFADPERGTGLAHFGGGTDGGAPLVLYDSARQTLVLSPLTHFKTGIQTRSSDLGGSLACGVQGQVTHLPAGFTLETILSAGHGITASVHAWGDALLRYHGKTRAGPGRDSTVKYLGYWTDNGAYYYYHTEPKKNYQETLRDARADHVRAGLPFHYMQLDSWWYPKGKDGGVTRWEARPDVFPDGVAGLHQTLGLPFVMHNRWWSPTTDYAKTYPFIVNAGSAIPIARPFWDSLMARVQQEGCLVYEQDWLVDQYHMTDVLRRDPEAAEMWLRNMGRAAGAHGLTVQYCMPLPADVLETVEIPAVTQVRVSGDYHPGNGQWRIGTTSLLAWALGLAPFKDTFWTTAQEPGSPYGDKAREPNPELETLVSALSAGPIGPGDGIGLTNTALLMKVCRQDGLLLKPDKPATPLDRWFLDGQPGSEVWETGATIGNKRWHYVLGIGLKTAYSVTSDDLGSRTPAVAYNPDTGTTVALDTKHPLALTSADRGTGAVPFSFWVVAPRSSQGWAFLGETGKFVTVSRQRFGKISADGRTLRLQGAPGEVVSLQWSAPTPPRRVTVTGHTAWTYDRARRLLTVPVTLPTSGRAEVRVEAAR